MEPPPPARASRSTTTRFWAPWLGHQHPRTAGGVRTHLRQLVRRPRVARTAMTWRRPPVGAIKLGRNLYGRIIPSAQILDISTRSAIMFRNSTISPEGGIAPGASQLRRRLWGSRPVRRGGSRPPAAAVPVPQHLNIDMLSTETEIDLLEKILESSSDIRQRDLARIIGLSLGMANVILKRLVQKGLLKIQKVNNRNIRYVVSPRGMERIARRSYRYFRQTVKNVVFYKGAIEELLQPRRSPGLHRDRADRCQRPGLHRRAPVRQAPARPAPGRQTRHGTNRQRFSCIPNATRTPLRPAPAAPTCGVSSCPQGPGASYPQPRDRRGSPAPVHQGRGSQPPDPRAMQRPAVGVPGAHRTTLRR